jgi:flagellar basal body rod protein FlgC
MAAQSVRLNTIASNLANADTVAGRKARPTAPASRCSPP